MGGDQGGSFKEENMEVQSPLRPKKVSAKEGGVEQRPTNARLRRQGWGRTFTR